MTSQEVKNRKEISSADENKQTAEPAASVLNNPLLSVKTAEPITRNINYSHEPKDMEKGNDDTNAN